MKRVTNYLEKSTSSIFLIKISEKTILDVELLNNPPPPFPFLHLLLEM